MLEFFRRYQTFFFAFITVIIVISFSFFGTFNTVGANAIHEQVAFKAIDGSEITRRELDEMVYFISTDSEDKLLLGGAWGPNFLNDGVIAKQFLQTGLAEELIAAYPSLIDPDLRTRLLKEQRFSLYEHPQAKFIGVDTAWSYFAPEMKRDYQTLQNSEQPLTPDAFRARVNLYLAERKLPSQMLRQILRYQQQQFAWVKPDPSLERIDLALFGYRTADDWFGPRFMRLVAEFIINASKIAESKGYTVSKEEAYTDLLRNAEVSFQQNVNNPQIGVANRSEYFNEQLRQLGMDQNKAVKVWQQVLLFRRLFNDVGNAVWLDSASLKQYFTFANEETTGELYRLPLEFHLGNYKALQRFTIYLDSTAGQQKDPLAIPQKILSVQEVAKAHPELIHKRYKLELQQVNKNALATKVSIRDMWNWEMEQGNWEILKKEFPELGVKTEGSIDKRVAVLDNLDPGTRARVDAFARKKIVDSHQEWIVQALQTAPSKQLDVGIRLNGGSNQFGLSDRKPLIQLLDQTSLAGQEPLTSEAINAANKLALFTGDGETYYKIKVINRGEQQILTFAEATQEGVLDQLLDRQLENYYVKIRDSKADQFQKADKGWKELATVRDQVADLYFEPLLTALRGVYSKVNPDGKSKAATGEQLASIRFYPYVSQIRDSLSKGQNDQLYLRQEDVVPSIQDQWKVEKVTRNISRSQDQEDSKIDQGRFASLPVNSWSGVEHPLNGDLHFFYIKARSGEKGYSDQTRLLAAHEGLTDAAERSYSKRVISQLKEKNAISLEFLDYTNEEEMTKEASNSDV